MEPKAPRDQVEARYPYLDFLYSLAHGAGHALEEVATLPWRDAALECISLRHYEIMAVTSSIQLHVIDFRDFDPAAYPEQALLQTFCMLALSRAQPEPTSPEDFRATWEALAPGERTSLGQRCGWLREGWLDEEDVEPMEAGAFHHDLTNYGVFSNDARLLIDPSLYENILGATAPFAEAPGVKIDLDDTSIEHVVWIGFAGNKVVLKEYDLYD